MWHETARKNVNRKRTKAKWRCESGVSGGPNIGISLTRAEGKAR
jgi:hypothetical protein